MTTLASSFEPDLREALLDELERRARRDIGPGLVATAREKWESYAAANDYDIDHVWEDVDGPIVERDDRGVRIRVEWPGLTALFEYGVSPHTINGNPLLHFYYERIDQWITTESVDWGSETGGIPESRAIRDSMNETRRELTR